MFSSRKGLRFSGVRLAIISVIGVSILTLVLNGTSVAGASVLDSVKEFFGFEHSVVATNFAAKNRPQNNTPQTLPFTQDWTNAGLITVDDDWSGVPGIIGYRGDDLNTVIGA
ncbi:MAG: hypothetical protein ACKVRN_05905, partial [Pyrinomonadaceae bacterium]